MILFPAESIRRKLCKNNKLSHTLLFVFSKNNSSVSERKSGGNEEEIYYFFNIFLENNMFSPDFHNTFFKKQISYFS
jgi:hypothetical protein